MRPAQGCREQARRLALSSNPKQVFARNSFEYIPFDQPGAAVKAIREVYAASKEIPG